MDAAQGNGTRSDAPGGSSSPSWSAPEPPRRYQSLQDYLRVLRRHKVLIAIALVAAVGVALALSATKDERYEATASLLVRDVSQDLNFLNRGSSTAPELPPNVRAALSAEEVTSPTVARVAARILDSGIAPQALLARVSTRVQVQTNLVEIVGIAGTAEAAAQIANAFATAASRVIPRDVDQRLRESERALSESVRQARQEQPTSGRAEVLELQRQQISLLRQIADPVQITDVAQPPANPASPNHARAATIGALIGALLGLLGAFGRDALDRRFHNAREVHEEFGMPVLGRISETTFASPGLAGNGLPMLDSDFEAFRVLRTNLAFSNEESPPRTVLVTSGLPEEGKSTVSMSLACASVLAGQRTLLVECDLRRPSFAKRFGIKGEPGLSEYLAGTVTPQEILQVVDLIMPVSANGSLEAQPTPAGKQLVVISAGQARPGAAELLATDRFTDFLSKVGKAYDLVVVDAGPLLAVVDPLVILPHADLVLICARVRRTTRDEAHATRAALEHLPDKPIGVVVTGMRRGDLGDYYYGY